jgi:hypothetical protein
MVLTELRNRFTYHAPDNDKRFKHETVRSLLGDMAEELNDYLPEGREKSLVMTHLEEAMFWSNAAIARNNES